MKNNPVCCLTLLWIMAAAFGMPGLPRGFAAEAAAPETGPFDYAKPELFTGTLYALGSQRTNLLFTFRRTATRSNSVVHVVRQFVRPDGFLAAQEDVVYDSNRLLSLQMREFQAKVSGAVLVTPDPQNPGQPKLYIGYGRGLEPPKGESQPLPPDTLIDDTIYPFMLAHWDDLMQGTPVKFHFISLEWKRVFGFQFVKSSECTLNGATVELIKMEPTSRIVSKLVDPLVFTIEKAAPHRIIQYVGRTTPRFKKGKSWKYLDAETVFDWN